MAVLPLLRHRARLHLDATCLVIGSMAPDFEYFARVKLADTIGHTLAGLVLWCLPVTVVCAAVFHHLVKRPALLVAPRALAARLAPLADRPWRPRWTPAGALVIVASAVLGAATHLAWDGLTHATGWGPRNFAALRVDYPLPVLGAMPLHRILQHGSTLIGLTVLAIVITRALRSIPPVEVAPRRRGPRVVWLACTAAATALAFAKVLANHETDAGSLVVAAVVGLLAGAIVASALLVRRAR